MKSFLRKFSAAAIGLIISAMSVLALTPLVSAQATDIITDTDRPPIITERTESGSFRTVAMTMLNFFLSFLGFIAVIFVIYGGIMYVTAGGQQEKVDNAKKIIMYAGAGLIIILLSFALVNTILGAGTATEPV